MSTDERLRLNRQLRLPNWNQEVLKQSKVLIAGVGGLGCEIAKNLAMVGVGTIYLIDMDIVEYSNLNRQLLFFNAKEGTSKALAAKHTLEKINPHVKYHAIEGPLEELDPQVYEEMDLYIAGLDSMNARLELNRRAVINNKPLIDGGTATYYGHVYSYIPGRNACLNCNPMREQEVDDLAACTLVGRPRKRNHCILKGQLFFESEHGRLPDASEQDEVQIVVDYANKLMKEHFPHEERFTLDDAVISIDQREPAIITINAVIASLQSQDAVRLLHHLAGKKLGIEPLQYTIYNGLTSSFFQFEKDQNKQCSTCGSNAPSIYKINVPKTSTLDTVLLMLKSRGFEYDPELLPIFWKIDTMNMYELELPKTLEELNIKNKEIILINDIRKKGTSTDNIYLKIIFD